MRIVLSCVVARTYISERETHTQADTIASILLNFKPISALFAVCRLATLQFERATQIESVSFLFISVCLAQPSCLRVKQGVSR